MADNKVKACAVIHVGTIVSELDPLKYLTSCYAIQREKEKGRLTKLDN